MISDQHKLILIHIPKTAGQSLNKLFLGGGWDDESNHGLEKLNGPMPIVKVLTSHLGGLIWYKDRFNVTDIISLNHLTYSEIASLGEPYVTKLQRYFTCAFVRNPWDRLVSSYVYWNIEETLGYDFDFFVSRIVEEDFGPLLQRLNSAASIYQHTRPQSDYIVDSAGSVYVDFIGKVEHIDYEIVRLCKKVGVEFKTLPKINTTDHERYEYMFSRKLVEKVGRYYGKDIDKFGYEYGVEPVREEKE